jgi:hypothetical protein
LAARLLQHQEPKPALIFFLVFQLQNSKSRGQLNLDKFKGFEQGNQEAIHSFEVDAYDYVSASIERTLSMYTLNPKIQDANSRGFRTLYNPFYSTQRKCNALMGYDQTCQFANDMLLKW